MKVEWVPATQLLRLQRRSVEIEPDTTYQEIGVRSFGRGLFLKDPVSGVEIGSKRVFEIHEGDFVVSNVFAWEGAVGIAGAEHHGRIGSHRFMTWIPVSDVKVDYLAEFFRSSRGVEALAAASPGSAGRNRTLSIANFEAIRVPLPSDADQERIAAHLSSLGVVASAARHAARIEPESLLTRAVMHVAAGQPQRSLGELLQRSRPWIQLDQSSTYRPIGVRGFGRGMIRYPETDADALSKLRYFAVKPGSLIVSNIKAWEGAVCTARESDDGRIGSNRFLQYTVKDPAVTVEWIERYLLTPEGVALLSAASPGSADRNRTLSMEGFERILIPVPPTAAQRSIRALANTVARAEAVRDQRDVLAAALLPAARNEIFNAMR